MLNSVSVWKMSRASMPVTSIEFKYNSRFFMVAIHIMSIDSLLTTIQCMFDLNTTCLSFILNPSYSFDRVVLLIRIPFRWDDGNTVFRHMIFLHTFEQAWAIVQASDKGSSPLMLINSRLKQAHPRLRISTSLRQYSSISCLKSNIAPLSIFSLCQAKNTSRSLTDIWPGLYMSTGK